MSYLTADHLAGGWLIIRRDGCDNFLFTGRLVYNWGAKKMVGLISGSLQ